MSTPFAIVTGASSGIGLKVGQEKKDDRVVVVRVGFDAMMRGDGDVVSGRKNELQSAIAHDTPARVLATQHRRMAAPGCAQKANE